MCHLAWTLKSKSQLSNAHILSTKSWKMFVLIQLDLEGNSCLDKVLKMGKISNTSWNKKMNTGISHISKCRYVCKYYCIDVVKCRTLIFHGIEWIIPLRKVQRRTFQWRIFQWKTFWKYPPLNYPPLSYPPFKCPPLKCPQL